MDAGVGVAGTDLHSKILDASPIPPRSNFLHFHSNFGEMWPNNRLAPPSRNILDPSLGSWDILKTINTIKK